MNRRRVATLLLIVVAAGLASLLVWQVALLLGGAGASKVVERETLPPLQSGPGERIKVGPTRLELPPVGATVDRAALDAAPGGEKVTAAMRTAVDRELARAVEEVQQRLDADRLVGEVISPIGARRVAVAQLLAAAPPAPTLILLAPFDDLEKQARKRARIR